ncbi:hypothetical protein [Mycobacteroides franklinii]|uniref:SLOG domain-containing protein n=1 Tax=Mycobacteroides franklinii TaxID=948102 RepID=UPI0010589D0A|nr:hypothetical protein [Mycobacteroides franklinii]
MSAQPLADKPVFLSASIPDPARWDGAFDALEITDAVVAVARAVLSAGGSLVTAAHPTIAPLLLYVAAELESSDTPQVVVYQSAVFDDILPEATRRFEADGIGTIIRTPAAKDEAADPAHAPVSLDIMRRQMLNETRPAAAVFVGGMKGIPTEYALFAELRSKRPMYAFGFPGGEARWLAESASAQSSLHELLASGNVYPAIARELVRDVARST